jgi:PAS domain S-box-containing protein
MEQPTTGILRLSSDAIIIIGLADGTVLDVNEAFLAVTGYAQHDLVGRPGHDLLVRVAQASDPAEMGFLEDLGSTTVAPIGLWTGSGELRVGDMSALILKVEGQHVALCTVRALTEPTPGQRRLAARQELVRIERSGTPWPEAGTTALQAFGRCLRWELGALWRGAPGLENLYCAAVWHAPNLGLEQLAEATRHAGFPPGMEPARRALLRGEPVWISDALAESRFPPQRGDGGVPLRGRLVIPARGGGGIIGLAEFLCHEVRLPDPELLAMIWDFGHLFGRLLEAAQAADAHRTDETRTVAPGMREWPLEILPGTFADLVGAVAAATEALERQPTLPGRAESTVVFRELLHRIGRLNRLLEDATQASTEPTVGVPPALPAGLTLKAVSQRTRIPAATLRTWEHRYGFMRPRRSPAGYRLYGEEEIARIEQVKYLLAQGVRVGAAMKAVIEEARRDARDGSQPPGDQTAPSEHANDAAIYRLTPRSPGGLRS